jgi:hypothetical protein
MHNFNRTIYAQRHFALPRTPSSSSEEVIDNDEVKRAVIIIEIYVKHVDKDIFMILIGNINEKFPFSICFFL